MLGLDLTHFDPIQGTIDGVPMVQRRLSDLRGYFADTAAYDARIAAENPVVYSVASVEPAQGDGQLHYGIGVVAPGQVGAEYYMTKGHFHAWRPAAEFYFGLSGQGLMLLESEDSGDSRWLPLTPNSAVYVPGSTAHRTINTGSTPLVYIGVYPAAAGHDYGVIAERNFRKVVVAVDGQPTVLDRDVFPAGLKPSTPANRMD